MRQSGDYLDGEALTLSLRGLLRDAVAALDIDQARSEVSRFIRDPRELDVWSEDLFHQALNRIQPV